MKLFVTGASGFLGRYVVASAVERGHEVRALVRPGCKAIPVTWKDTGRVEVCVGDLRHRSALPAMLTGIDCVVHLAATKSGDLYEQLGGTVVATECLLEGMANSNVRQMVLTSSFAVYEYMRRWSWGRLDEDSQLALKPEERDEYCQTKLFQERLVQEHANEHGWRLVVLRPGVIFGPNNLWSARLGTQLSDRWWLCTGALNEIPLTYVENCADAVVLSAEQDDRGSPLVLNVLDGHSPRQISYVRALRRQLEHRPRVFPIPWWAMRMAARLAWFANRIVFRGRGKLPGVITPTKLHARCKPLRYCNDRIADSLNWSPRYSWREGLSRSLAQKEPELTTLHGNVDEPQAQPVAVRQSA